ncbi:MAG: NifU family protein [Bacteroidales bacterium]|nr:NifU family protein [Bacteroidales bacterium]
MEEQTLEQKVKSILEQIRPYLRQDGGDVEFVEMTADNVVKVRLRGACGSCPHATMTLKQGIEAAMIKALPEVKAVESV